MSESVETQPEAVRPDHKAAVSALLETMTRQELQAALYEADIDAFHAAEAAKAPKMPTLGPATWDALKAHLTDGAGHMDLQRELLAAHVALHKDDQAAFWLGVIAHYKLGLLRVPKPAVQAALAAAQSPATEKD